MYALILLLILIIIYLFYDMCSRRHGVAAFTEPKCTDQKTVFYTKKADPKDIASGLYRHGLSADALDDCGLRDTDDSTNLVGNLDGSADQNWQPPADDLLARDFPKQMQEAYNWVAGFTPGPAYTRNKSCNDGLDGGDRRNMKEDADYYNYAANRDMIPELHDTVSAASRVVTSHTKDGGAADCCYDGFRESDVAKYINYAPKRSNGEYFRYDEPNYDEKLIMRHFPKDHPPNLFPSKNGGITDAAIIDTGDLPVPDYGFGDLPVPDYGFGDLPVPDYGFGDTENLEGLEDKPAPKGAPTTSNKPPSGLDTNPEGEHIRNLKQAVLDIYMSNNSTPNIGDELLAKKSLDVGRQFQNSIINRARFNVESFRPYVAEELNDNENRVWWEQDLEWRM